MKIISSQHYLDWNIINEKMQELDGVECVEILCCEIGGIDGEEYAVQVDGHHTLAAARELGIQAEFTFCDPLDSLRGEEFLQAHYMDGDWYDVERSNPAEERYCLIW